MSDQENPNPAGNVDPSEDPSGGSQAPVDPSEDPSGGSQAPVDPSEDPSGGSQALRGDGPNESE